MQEETLRYQFGTVEVQPAAFAVLRNGNPVELEPKAVRVLLFLIEHRDRAVSKEELMEAVWKDTAVTDNALTRIVAQIRRELSDDARQPRVIQTFPTFGYRFIAPDLVIQPAVAPPPAAITPRSTRRWWLVPGAALFFIAIALSWLVFRNGFSGANLDLPSTQLTTSAGLDIGASFSPDGKSFVYSSDRSGRFEIYRRTVAAAVEEPVTNDGKQNIEPAWSPDGKWIAYHSVARHGIWLVPVAGGPARQLTDFGSGPSWSPDGTHIVFGASDLVSFTWADLPGINLGQPMIWMAAVDGSQLQQLTTLNNPPGQHMMPSWTPDGKDIVFVAVSANSAIWKLNLSSGKLDMLVQYGRDLPRVNLTRTNLLRTPRYSPTGKGLYFCAKNDQGSYAIYWLPRPGARPRILYSTRGEAPSALALSPDGRHLIFTRFVNVSQLWTSGSSGELRPLFQESVLRAYRPSFSPDGKILAFMVETVGRNYDVWTMNADGTGAGPVSSDPGTKEVASIWNLAGTGLFYKYYGTGVVQFRRYDTRRKTSEVLFSWPSDRGLFLPTLMPEEKEVISACSKPLNICLSPAGGGPPRQITFERERAAYPSVSRDGQWIAYEVRQGASSQLGLTDRNGNHHQILTEGPGLSFPGLFSEDGRRISYAAYRDGVWNICWIDRITHEHRQVTHFTTFGPFVRYPAFWPGREEIVFEYSQVKGNVYLLDLP